VPKQKINTLSLFTGAGGLDIGFHQEGFNIITCIELEGDFCKTLELNKGDYISEECEIINNGIEYFQPQSIAKKIDFIIGGPPCQSFSASGRRTGGASGLNDKRGTLFEHYCRIISYFQPNGFLFENVRGLMGVNGGRAWSLIFDSFEALGYKLSYRLLDSALYGAPQHRERIILVGTKKDKFLFPFPTHGPQSIKGQNYVTAGEALSNVGKNDVYNIPANGGGKYDHLIPEIPPGSNYSYFTAELGHPNPVFAWRSKFSDFLYKADPKQPVKTLQANPGKYSGPFHWESRKMTVSELKRLQTFPDNYKFFGNYNKIVKQIGNSVVPVFGRKLAQAVKQQLFHQPKKYHIAVMDMDFNLVIDYRKALKARNTRTVTAKNKAEQFNLFSKENKQPKSLNNYVTKTYYMKYATYENRRIIDANFQANNSNDNLFICSSSLEKGIAYLEVIKSGKSFKKIWTINLRFFKTVVKGLRGINCKIYSDEINDFVIGWDYIELFIKDNSAYSSLIDIFGHFSEPRPKFRLDIINHKRGRHSFTENYFNFISDFDKVSKLHPLSTLRILAVNEKKYKSLIKELQELRFDIRINNNSPNIHKDFFLPCYPFPRPYGKQSAFARI